MVGGWEVHPAASFQQHVALARECWLKPRLSRQLIERAYLRVLKVEGNARHLVRSSSTSSGCGGAISGSWFTGTWWQVASTRPQLALAMVRLEGGECFPARTAASA